MRFIGETPRFVSQVRNARLWRPFMRCEQSTDAANLLADRAGRTFQGSVDDRRCGFQFLGFTLARLGAIDDGKG